MTLTVTLLFYSKLNVQVYKIQFFVAIFCLYNMHTCRQGMIRISKKDRQHNGQKKKDKRTNNDLQILKHHTEN
jgi:hypothetical protein